MNPKRAALAIVAFVSCFLAAGQETGKGSLFGKVLGMISKPSLSYDSTAIYQPAPHWRVAVSGNLRQAGVSQRNEFTYGSAMMDSHGNVVEAISPAYTYSELQGGVDKTIGLNVGYGNLSLGYNQKVGGIRKNVNKSLSFDYMANGAALQLQYFDFRQPIKYDMRIGNKDDWFFYQDSGETDNPGRMRAFIADVLYSFNNRTFAYSAVYKGNKIQRHSAGTWMFGAKYIQGMVENDPGEDLSSYVGGMARQTSRQISFGGGFSYNLVPYHRQPSEDGWKGFRNITLNLTAVPMVTLFNQFSSIMYELGPDGKYQEGTNNTMNGKLLVNYVVRAGAIYSWDNYYASLTASYDSYSYKGKSSVEYEGELYDNVISSGRFSRWTAGFQFCMKF